MIEKDHNLARANKWKVFHNSKRNQKEDGIDSN